MNKRHKLRLTYSSLILLRRKSWRYCMLLVMLVMVVAVMKIRAVESQGGPGDKFQIFLVVYTNMLTFSRQISR